MYVIYDFVVRSAQMNVYWDTKNTFISDDTLILLMYVLEVIVIDYVVLFVFVY